MTRSPVRSVLPALAAFRRIAGLLLVAATAAGPVFAEEEATSPSSEILFVGDSVTAGVWFLSLGDRSASEAWPAQLLERLGRPAPVPRLPRPYPLDYWKIATRGFGFGGWRFPWSALPVLKPRRPLFGPDEPRSIVAVPGQTAADVLDQTGRESPHPSAGRTFASLLLPAGRTALETAEAGARSPRRVVLFVGANDVLAALGMVEGLHPLPRADFARDYEEIARRLRRVMDPAAPADHLILVTLPDVTRLPLLQTVPEDAVDAGGEPLPPGTKASVFLLAFRDDRFEAEEVRTPAQLAAIRARAEVYNEEIRTIARRHGFAVFDLSALLAELAEDPAFGTVASPYFSPDLHHPSALTHARIAEGILETMRRTGGVGEAGTRSPAPAAAPTLPSAAEMNAEQRARAAALMRVSLLGMSTGEFPPRPTWRIATEVGAHAGSERRLDGSLAGLLAIEIAPGPVGGRWVSRSTVGVRAAVGWDEDGGPKAPRDAVDARAGLGFERLGAWHWARIEAGLRWDRADGFGGYARGEWRALFAEGRTDGVTPDELVAGIRWGIVPGRPGRNGN